MAKPAHRTLSVLAITGVIMAACSTTPEPGHIGGETISPIPVVPLVEARRKAILLELKIQDVLTRKYGVGQWNPPQKNSQVTASSTVTCPDGYVTESWDFATAGPIKDSRWREAVERVYKILKPLGYDKPAMRQIRNDHITVFNRPGTGGHVEIRYDKATVIIVNTGCAKGETWEGWPNGTEVLPERLRTTGRAPIHLDHEVWPAEAPGGNSTTPSSPANNGQSTPAGEPATPLSNSSSANNTDNGAKKSSTTGDSDSIHYHLISSRFPYIP